MVKYPNSIKLGINNNCISTSVTSKGKSVKVGRKFCEDNNGVKAAKEEKKNRSTRQMEL